MTVFMKKVIKEFWNVLKSEYENEYKENIFKNYSQTERVLEDFRTYLKDLFLKYPSNVDIVCVLASVELELRYEKNAIKLLEGLQAGVSRRCGGLLVIRQCACRQGR